MFTIVRYTTITTDKRQSFKQYNGRLASAHLLRKWVIETLNTIVCQFLSESNEIALIATMLGFNRYEAFNLDNNVSMAFWVKTEFPYIVSDVGKLISKDLLQVVQIELTEIAEQENKL